MHELEKLARRGQLAYTYEVRQLLAPAAGTDFSFTPRPGEIWQLVAVRALLTASAVAGNRTPQLTISDGTSTVITYPATVVSAALAVNTYQWIAGYPNFLAAAEAALVTVPIVDNIILPGWTVAPITANRDVGDTWTKITFTILRYDTPPHNMATQLGVSYDELADAINHPNA